MPDPDDGRFPVTQWSLFSRIRGGDERDAQRALNELCSQYHYPLYCYIRRRGLEHHDAQDALHDFLAKLLRNDSLKELREVDGKLRGFLGKALQRFLHNWHRDHANERAEIS
ncbi:MAG: sigma-70 family RNA polymerase sigma factor, partial [Fimbriimonadaceae bacterium]